MNVKQLLRKGVYTPVAIGLLVVALLIIIVPNSTSSRSARLAANAYKNIFTEKGGCSPDFMKCYWPTRSTEPRDVSLRMGTKFCFQHLESEIGLHVRQWNKFTGTWTKTGVDCKDGVCSGEFPLKKTTEVRFVSDPVPANGPPQRYRYAHVPLVPGASSEEMCQATWTLWAQ